MLKLELKRIFSKKINVFAIGLALILAVIFSGFAVTSNRYVDENGNAIRIYWEKDGVFTTIPALPCYDEAPEGMSDAQHQRLRKSVDDVTALMGGRLAVLEK